MEKEKRTINITIKATASMNAALEELAAEHQRSVSQVGFLLILRGLNLYRQDDQ